MKNKLWKLLRLKCFFFFLVRDFVLSARLHRQFRQTLFSLSLFFTVLVHKRIRKELNFYAILLHCHYLCLVVCCATRWLVLKLKFYLLLHKIQILFRSWLLMFFFLLSVFYIIFIVVVSFGVLFIYVLRFWCFFFCTQVIFYMNAKLYTDSRSYVDGVYT